MRVALEAVEREKSVKGSYLWKWFPEPRAAGRNFRMAEDRIRRVIREAWAADSGVKDGKNLKRDAQQQTGDRR